MIKKKEFIRTYDIIYIFTKIKKEKTICAKKKISLKLVCKYLQLSIQRNLYACINILCHFVLWL